MSAMLQADDIEVNDSGEEIESVEETRGLLPSIANSVDLKPLPVYTTLISPASLGNKTTVLSCCKVFQLTKSFAYTPLSEAAGCPMIHMVGKGATLDLCHNCMTFNESGVASNCVGVEVGYSPNDIGSATQPDSVIIENGIFCNWDVAILVHAGVRNVTLRNLILTNNTIPIAMIGQNDTSDNEVCTVYLENVSIVGDGAARLSSLQWIRSKLTDGTDFGAGAAVSPSGYTVNEVMPRECDPVDPGALDSLYVYTGIYCNAVSNIKMKNVSVSHVGFDGDTGGSTAEKTATYGMWFRDCHSLFMQDVQSIKNKSGLTTVGMYFDESSVISLKNANISHNFVTDVGDTVTPNAVCPEGRWAAAVVLRDVNVASACDFVISNTSGLETTFGVRTILNPVTRSNDITFENGTADFLRGDRVYGFDLGDQYRKNTSGRLPSGGVRNLKMENVSISSAHGRDDSAATNYPENDIAVEFKGIHLGDGSQDVNLNSIRIESNNVLAAATGTSSGIEFGSLSTATNTPAGIGAAVGTLKHARFDSISISGNRGGGIAEGRFVGMRANSTGTVAPQSVGTNVFEDIVISNSYITGNQLDAVRSINDSGTAGSITLKGLALDNVSLSGNVDGAGIAAEQLSGVQAQKVEINNNGTFGLQASSLDGVTLSNVSVSSNGVTAGTHHGINVTNLNNLRATKLTVDSNAGHGLHVTTAVNNVVIQDFSLSSNGSKGGFFGSTANSVSLKHGSIINTAAVAGSSTDGLVFPISTDVDIEHVKIDSINSTEATTTSGISILNSAQSLRLDDIAVTNLSGSAGTTYAIYAQDVKEALFQKIAVSTISSAGASNDSYGIYFDASGTTAASVENVSMDNVRVNNIVSAEGDAIACQLQAGVGVTLKDIDFSGAVTSAIATQKAVGLHLLCLDSVGFGSVTLDDFSCNHQRGALAYGILLEEAATMTAGISPLDSAVFKNGSASNNVSTNGVAYGVQLQENSTASEVGVCNITFENVSMSKNSSTEGSCAGLHVQRPESIRLHSVTANNNESTGSAQFDTHGILLETSVDNLELLTVTTSGNVAVNGNATGIQVDKATVVHADGLIANDNRSKLAAAAPTTLESEVKGIFFKASVGSEQSAGCIMNNLQACGNINAYRSYGIHLQEPTGLSMHRIDASSNKSDQLGTVNGNAVLSQAVGLLLEGGSSVTISDLHASVNSQAELTAANLLSSATGIADESVANTTADIARHFPVANESGAYGLLAFGTMALSVDGGSLTKNEGVRSFGMLLKDGDNTLITHIDASENKALGDALNPITGTNTAMVIPAAQGPTIFGDPTGPVNLKEAYAQYVKALSQVNSTAINGSAINLCSEAAGAVSPGSTVSSTADIIWATIAQFRRFSTAVGIGAYNASGVTIDSCRAIGNSSEHDSAAGIALYGCGSKGHLVQNCVTAHNKCWTDSQRGGSTFDIDGDFDISAWLPFYTFVEALRYVSETVNGGTPPDDTYTLTPITSPVTAAQIALKPTSLTQPEGAVNDEWILNERRLTIGFDAGPAVQNLYNFATVGPIAAGILLEGQRDSSLLQNNAYCNQANAGLGFGIVSDGSSATMFMDNKATNNEADALGYAWGLADISYSTPNSWYKNWMSANRVDVYMKSSLHIVFDTAFSSSQSLPLQVIQPGSVESLMRSLPFDNIVVELVNCRQIQDCLGDCVKTHLADIASVDSLTDPGNPANIIAGANTTGYPGCTTCT